MGLTRREYKLVEVQGRAGHHQGDHRKFIGPISYRKECDLTYRGNQKLGNKTLFYADLISVQKMRLLTKMHES